MVHRTLVWVSNWRADTIFHSPVPKRLFGVGQKSHRRLLTYGHTQLLGDVACAGIGADFQLGSLGLSGYSMLCYAAVGTVNTPCVGRRYAFPTYAFRISGRMAAFHAVSGGMFSESANCPHKIQEDQKIIHVVMTTYTSQWLLG
jgi:hypothetical protein